MVDQNDQNQNVPPTANQQNDQNQNDPPTANQQNDRNHSISRIQVRVPPFWKQNPQLWFRQLEAQFANSNINQDLTKFNTIVGTVESDILSSVSDIVLNPPAIDMYETIKARLIKEFANSDNKKIRSLLNDLPLGDMKPSSLLRKMKELACGKVGDDLLKTLWMQRLPTTIHTVLATSTEPLDQLALHADEMFDISDHSAVQAISSPADIQFNDLVNVVHSLDGKIESLKTYFREPRNRNGRSSRSRSLTPVKKTASDSKSGLCYYHKQFGKKANKCKKPCDFNDSKSKN